MQLAITYLLVAIATGYAFFELAKMVRPAKQVGSCGHGCGGCPGSKIPTKKGESAELIPLELVIQR